MHELILDITLATLAAWVFALVAHVTRQPLILAYLVGGFLIGPSGLGWVRSQESIATISELGLIFMLFMIGLEIDLKKIVQAGRVIVVTAASQMGIGCILGVGFFMLLGMTMDATHWDVLYLAVAAAMSSTVIIVKVLYEKRELDTLPGRITIGVLVLQDLFAILFLAIQPSLGNLQVDVILLSVGRVATLVAAALLISRFVLPRLFHQVARLPELVLLGAIAWCFLLGQFAVLLNLSREMGALIAGVSVSTFPYALDVTAKVTTLRDFFITLFFVSLGMTISLPTGSVVGLALLLVAFTIVSRLLTTFTPLYLMEQGLRTSLLPAVNLCQISEFSLVLIQVGLVAGQISAATASAASLAFAILAALSTFAMMNSDALARRAIVQLKRLGLRDLDHHHATEDTAHFKPRILLLGFFRAASSLLSELEREHATMVPDVCVVDFNPHAFRSLQARGVKVFYGDISNPETLTHAGVANAEIVVSSVPDALLKGTTNERLTRYVRAINPTAKIIATSDVLANTAELYAAGADYVVVSRLAEANELIDVINAVREGLLADQREQLDERLRDRNEVLP